MVSDVAPRGQKVPVGGNFSLTCALKNHDGQTSQYLFWTFASHDGTTGPPNSSDHVTIVNGRCVNQQTCAIIHV